MTNKIKLVEMKSSNMLTRSMKNRSKRDVETAVKETNTRTELSVKYSMSSVNTNIQTDHVRPISDDRKSIEMEYMGRVVQKLHVARKILNPVIDEIITTATIMSETELTASHNAPLCSLSRTEYQGALRASQIFNEINQELSEKYRNKPLIVGKNFRFPMRKPIITMACFPKKSKSKTSSNSSVVEAKDRIYIDKELMLKLIELYEMLGETIKRLKHQQSTQRTSASSSYHPIQPSAPPASQSDLSRYSESSDEGSRPHVTTSSKTTSTKPALKPMNKAATLFESPQQAHERAAKCLQTLSDVQAYLEAVCGGNVDLLNLFELAQLPETHDCGHRGLPHLHATLNGIPVILMSLISNSEKLTQGSLISESFSNTHEKHFQDSNRKFSSAQHTKEKALSSHSSSSISACSCIYSCPNSDMECACTETNSYSKHEIFSAGSVNRQTFVAQTRESTFGQSSLPSQSLDVQATKKLKSNVVDESDDAVTYIVRNSVRASITSKNNESLQERRTSYKQSIISEDETKTTTKTISKPKLKCTPTTCPKKMQLGTSENEVFSRNDKNVSRNIDRKSTSGRSIDSTASKSNTKGGTSSTINKRTSTSSRLVTTTGDKGDVSNDIDDSFSTKEMISSTPVLKGIPQSSSTHSSRKSSIISQPEASTTRASEIRMNNTNTSSVRFAESLPYSQASSSSKVDEKLSTRRIGTSDSDVDKYNRSDKYSGSTSGLSSTSHSIKSLSTQSEMKTAMSNPKSGKRFKMTDLMKVAKPAKCCRKTCLNELPQATVPYPVSLLSLHLDQNDTKCITKRINANNETQIAYCTPANDNNFSIEQRVFQVAYFTIHQSLENYSSDPVLKKHDFIEGYKEM